MITNWQGPAALRSQFLLDPQVAYLNHGSFGACPRSVLARQGELRKELEREPVSFLHRLLPGRLAEARAALAGCLGCDADDVAYMPNVTFALNTAIRSLPLTAGDEVLCGDHEYGALERAWEAEGRRRGLVLRRVRLPLPIHSREEILRAYTAAAGPATRALFVSHVSSPTALCLPLPELLELARRRGWISLVDGAHAPGHLPLDLAGLQPDIYAGNCHKWLLAPKGCGFLMASAAAREWIQPLVTSWGGANRPEEERRGSFLDETEWAGTLDPTPWLALSAALEFRLRWDWDERAALCRRRLQAWGGRMIERFGMERVTPADGSLQMLALALPSAAGGPAAAYALHDRLFFEFGVEVPVMAFQDRALLRLSLQPYNREDDLARLEQALDSLLPLCGGARARVTTGDCP